MLVLSRKKNESIVISNDITVVVVEIRGDKVRLGIDTPKEVPVHRREVYEALQHQAAQEAAQRLEISEAALHSVAADISARVGKVVSVLDLFGSDQLLKDGLLCSFVLSPESLTEAKIQRRVAFLLKREVQLPALLSQLTLFTNGEVLKELTDEKGVKHFEKDRRFYIEYTRSLKRRFG